MPATPPLSESRIEIARRLAAPHGLDLDATLQIGGNYASFTEHLGLVHVSGQVPRVGSALVCTGRVGESVSLAQARQAAEVCVLRVLSVLHQVYGLDCIQRVLKMNVFVQCTADFTQQSEVSDAASDLLKAVLGPDGVGARTSVGVQQLPKDAPVEIDVAAALRAA